MRGTASQRWLVGLAGGALGSFAMNAFVRLVHATAKFALDAQGAARGADRVGRGVQPPPAPSTPPLPRESLGCALRHAGLGDPRRDDHAGDGSVEGPRQLSTGLHSSALAGHLIYGAPLEAVMRSFNRQVSGARPNL
jgi:hypothetical protein